MITRKATTQVTVVTGLVTNHQFYFLSQNKYLSSFAIENFKTNLYARGFWERRRLGLIRSVSFGGGDYGWAQLELVDLCLALLELLLHLLLEDGADLVEHFSHLLYHAADEALELLGLTRGASGAADAVE
jgi:hypothetical protein